MVAKYYSILLQPVTEAVRMSARKAVPNLRRFSALDGISIRMGSVYGSDDIIEASNKKAFQARP